MHYLCCAVSTFSDLNYCCSLDYLCCFITCFFCAQAAQQRLLALAHGFRSFKFVCLTQPKLLRALLFHTRRYGIVYHANYVTYFKRAIEDACSASGVRIHALQSMKYRAAASLGEVVACSGDLVSSVEGDCSRWRFELTDAADPSRVFVSAEATVSWPGGAALPPGTTVCPPSNDRTTAPAATQLLQPLPEPFADSPKTLEVVVWSDDLDGGGELSIRALLNYFERIRTLSLGRDPDGELGLMRLHREGVSVVVSGFLASVSAGVECFPCVWIR